MSDYLDIGILEMQSGETIVASDCFLTNHYKAPPSFNLNFEFEDSNYQPPPGYSVIFDFTDACSPKFNFNFPTGESFVWGEAPWCPSRWLPVDWDKVDIDLDNPWEVTPWDGINFIFECGGGDVPPVEHIDLGPFRGAQGESLQVELSPWDFNFASGTALEIEDLKVDLTNLSLSNWEGSSLTFPLEANIQFTLSASEGAEVNRTNVHWLVTRPAQDFSHTHQTGEQASFSMYTEMGMGTDFYEGSSFAADLVARSVVLLDLSMFEGTELKPIPLSVGALLIPYAWEGAAAGFSLEIAPGVGMDLPAAQGEHASLEVQVTPHLSLSGSEGAIADLDVTFHPAALFEIPFFEGTSLDVSVNVEQTFDIDFLDGSTATVDLTLVAPPTFALSGFQGEETRLAINTSQVFVLLGATGESAQVDLELAPTQDFILEAFEGASSDFSMSSTLSLGQLNFAQGEELHKFTIDIEQPSYIYTGEHVTFDIATGYNLPLFVFDGAEAKVTLDTRPSQGIGILRAYEGSGLDIPALWSLRSKLLSVEFGYADEMGLDFHDTGTSFDLTTDLCCGPRDNSGTWIDIGFEDPPEYSYAGDKTIFEIDLSTRARFKFSAFDGTVSTLKDYDVYLEFDSYDGSGAWFNTESIQDIRLCKGNFIPHGDHVDVEMIYTYDENCEITPMYTGETFAFGFLEANQNSQHRMYTGETMQFNVVAPDLWQFRIWEGAQVRLYFTDFPVSFAFGTSCSFAFEEPTLQAYDGTTFSIGKLVTEYDVWFDEKGCLDNEFVPQTEDGDADWEKHNPVPVELDTYYHEIKATCG